MIKDMNSYPKNGAFNLREAADYMGTNVTTMGELVRRAGFPAFRVGRRWVIPREAFSRWLNQQAEARAQL